MVENRTTLRRKFSKSVFYVSLRMQVSGKSMSRRLPKFKILSQRHQRPFRLKVVQILKLCSPLPLYSRGLISPPARVVAAILRTTVFLGTGARQSCWENYIPRNRWCCKLRISDNLHALWSKILQIHHGLSNVSGVSQATTTSHNTPRLVTTTRPMTLASL